MTHGCSAYKGNPSFSPPHFLLKYLPLQNVVRRIELSISFWLIPHKKKVHISCLTYTNHSMEFSSQCEGLDSSQQCVTLHHKSFFSSREWKGTAAQAVESSPLLLHSTGLCNSIHKQQIYFNCSLWLYPHYSH